MAPVLAGQGPGVLLRPAGYVAGVLDEDLLTASKIRGPESGAHTKLAEERILEHSNGRQRDVAAGGKGGVKLRQFKKDGRKWGGLSRPPERWLMLRRIHCKI
jgi:hypothetical protein